MDFKSLPFNKSSRRKEYFDFLNQPFHVGVVGLVNGEAHENITPYFYDWYGTHMLNWIKFTKDKYTLEFHDHKKFYKIINPSLDVFKEFTFPHPKTIMEFLSDLDRCGIEAQWSDYVIKHNDLKYILTTSEYKIYIDDLLNQIGKGKKDKNDNEDYSQWS